MVTFSMVCFLKVTCVSFEFFNAYMDQFSRSHVSFFMVTSSNFHDSKCIISW
jgi:hypothetical protein